MQKSDSADLQRQSDTDRRLPASKRGYERAKARSRRRRRRIRVIFLAVSAAAILLAVGISYSNAEGIVNSIQMSCLSFSAANFALNLGFTNPSSTAVSDTIVISGQVLNHLGDEHSGGPGSLIFAFSNESSYTLQPNQLTHILLGTGKSLANGTLTNGSLFHLQMTIHQDYSIFPYHFQQELPINTVGSTTTTTITYATGC